MIHALVMEKLNGIASWLILASNWKPHAAEADDLAKMNWLGYYWRQSKGYRLCPWRSPYIRWRAETYWGGDMSVLAAGEFFRMMWRERTALRRFLAWADEREREQRLRGDPKHRANPQTIE
jgi:hypothetical protein